MIEIKNLDFKYTKTSLDGEETTTHALKNVSMTINKGDFVAILGHNGSGKSTLAKCINGLIQANSGEVVVDGFKANDEAQLWDIRQRVGMVFQNPDNQMVATIVEDDVAFGCENLGLPSAEIRQRVDNALEWVNMTKEAKSAPNMLSGGQKQRVAIAGILAMKPEYIVFDEPTAMLDPKGRQEILNIAHRLNKEENITVIIITHFMEEVIDADKVYVMNDGVVEMSGNPNEIFGEVDRLEQIGLTVPMTTRIVYGLRQKGVELPKDIIKMDDMVEHLCQLK